MNRYEVQNMELGKLQHTVNTRSEFESIEFALQASKHLDDLRNINVNRGNLSVGFLIRPRETTRIQKVDGLTAQIDERGVLTLGSLSRPVRNQYQRLFGFETVNVKYGWQMGLRFADYNNPVNTYFIPHEEHVDILANVRHEDGSSVSLSPYPVRVQI